MKGPSLSLSPSRPHTISSFARAGAPRSTPNSCRRHSIADPRHELFAEMNPTEDSIRLHRLRQPRDTDSAQFRNTRNGTGCSSIPQNPYFFLLPLVGLTP
jgi:hypothetical protein